MTNPKIQALLDKEDIRTLVTRFARAADRHDHEAMRALYHEDAIDEHGDMFSGPAMDFIDTLPEIQANMATLHHNITTHNIMLDVDYAEGEFYLLAMHQAKVPDGPIPNGLIDVLIGGRYFDKYEKRDGIWKFSHRAIVTDWAHVDEPTRINKDHPFLAGSKLGCPGPDDPSYKFFRLFEWKS